MSTLATHPTQGTSASHPGRVSAGPYLLVLVQLGTLALVIRQFQIDQRAARAGHARGQQIMAACVRAIISLILVPQEAQQ